VKSRKKQYKENETWLFKALNILLSESDISKSFMLRNDTEPYEIIKIRGSPDVFIFSFVLDNP